MIDTTIQIPSDTALELTLDESIAQRELQIYNIDLTIMSLEKKKAKFQAEIRELESMSTAQDYEEIERITEVQDDTE